MKSFRIVVALRLAIFPLIFNLSIAQELEVNINESSFWTSNNEVCPAQLDENPENITQMDSYVADASQNYNFLSSWTEDLPHLAGWKGSYVQIDDFSTQDSSLNAQNDKDIQRKVIPRFHWGGDF